MKKPAGSNFEFQPIGFVQSPFKDKFGIPRQPGLVSQAQGVIKIANNPDLKTALRGLEEFTHLWIVFVFHDHGGNKWKPSIRPPRLGGARKVGVLASRSPHRPNPIGLSAVKLELIDFDAKDGVEIHVSGLDLLDGTPVLDLKPYLPYADSLPDAGSGWADAPIRRWPVAFAPEAEAQIRAADPNEERKLRQMIIEVLELDPRPAFQRRKLPVDDEKSWSHRFGFQFLGYEIKYRPTADGFFVLSLN